jgi:hypothetical protein
MFLFTPHHTHTHTYTLTHITSYYIYGHIYQDFITTVTTIMYLVI